MKVIETDGIVLKTMDFKENGPHLNEKWSELNHAIRFLIAIRQERSEDALNEAKTLLQEEKILN